MSPVFAWEVYLWPLPVLAQKSQKNDVRLPNAAEPSDIFTESSLEDVNGQS